MKRRIKFGFFGFLTLDHRAVEAYLDDMAGQGWALAHVWLGLVARFRRTDRTDLRYYVSVSDPRREDDPAYQERVTGCGWEKFGYVRYMNLYRSLPGAAVRPIHPDRAEKERRDRANVLRWCLNCVIVMVLLLLLQFFRWLLVGTPTVAELPRLAAASGTTALLLLFLVPVLAGGSVYLLFSALRMGQWHEAAERGESYPTPGLRGARLRGLLTPLAYLGAAFLAAAFFMDLIALPTDGTLIVLGAATGFATLAVFVTGKHWGRQPRRVKLARCAGIAAFLAAAAIGRGALLPVFAQMRADCEARLPALSAPYERVESRGNLVLSYARGSMEAEAGGPDTVAEYYDCRSARMADKMARALWNWDMTPVPGQTDVWEARREGRYDVLSRRGDIVRLVSMPEGENGPLRETLLEWVTG